MITCIIASPINQWIWIFILLILSPCRIGSDYFHPLDRPGLLSPCVVQSSVFPEDQTIVSHCFHSFVSFGTLIPNHERLRHDIELQESDLKPGTPRVGVIDSECDLAADLRTAAGHLSSDERSVSVCLKHLGHCSDICSVTVRPNAKLLWKRIPNEIKESNAEIQAVWKVGVKLFQRDLPDIYPLVDGVQWPSHLKNIMNCIKGMVADVTSAQ